MLEVEIIVGILGLIGVIASSVIAATTTSKVTRDKMMAQFNEQYNTLSKKFIEMNAKTNVMIDNLTKEVEKHNSVIERTFKLEQDNKNIFHRYDEIEERLKKNEETASHASERANAAHNRLDRSNLGI